MASAKGSDDEPELEYEQSTIDKIISTILCRFDFYWSNSHL